MAGVAALLCDERRHVGSERRREAAEREERPDRPDSHDTPQGSALDRMRAIHRRAPGGCMSPRSTVTVIRGPCTFSTIFAYEVTSAPVVSSTTTMRRNAPSRGSGSTANDLSRGSKRYNTFAFDVGIQTTLRFGSHVTE